MKPILSLCLIFLWCSCHQASSGGEVPQIESDTSQRFPKPDSLSHFKETVFVPTLESRIPTGKTAIYTPTLLLSWDKLREALPDGISLFPDAPEELKLLNTTSSFKDALRKGEYEVTAGAEGGLLYAKSKFSKSLPYKIPFDSLVDFLQFNNTPVRAFGLLRYDYLIVDNFSINSYKDADHFVVTLQPADTTQEIIMAKGLSHFSNLSAGIKAVNAWLAAGKTEEHLYFDTRDELAIPVLRFNLATRYSSLEQQSILSKSTSFLLAEVSQRIALVMDENGTEVESEAVAAAAVDSMPPAPKKLYFDKPYLVMMKRKTVKEPYFVMWVNNSELMMK
ncbi:MAG: hypothetical protein J7623_06665 [Chitinophaga sp.]|uniref:hypothetical protein n=1 Tax=Chitinophaga sp. TaxID=1869181 RepID=UPI001B11F90C|nr:hypothetical protein [Chitinophaga sp.]MBO9728305.1 hypothetical protein [Chitinophaga sp.]